MIRSLVSTILGVSFTAGSLLGICGCESTVNDSLLQSALSPSRNLLLDEERPFSIKNETAPFSKDDREIYSEVEKDVNSFVQEAYNMKREEFTRNEMQGKNYFSRGSVLVLNDPEKISVLVVDDPNQRIIYSWSYSEEPSKKEITLTVADFVINYSNFSGTWTKMYIKTFPEGISMRFLERADEKKILEYQQTAKNFRDKFK
ncbi:MAG: hypothetical protein KKE50_05015 [Nanoarchaeota archaeon]|nr:hypothetical protein [Nanoarchaeota archaeon]